jgi:phosphoglycerate dehydrogenase-like enzyme
VLWQSVSRPIRVINALRIEPQNAALFATLGTQFQLIDRPGADVDSLEDADAEVLLAQRPPASLEHLPRLRWTQVPTAGVESLISNPLLNQGLIVTNARGVYSGSIADYAIWAVLDFNQKGAIRRSGQRDRLWLDDKRPAAGRPLRGQTALIVGYGTIGREIARLLAALGVRVIAVKARPEIKSDDSFHPAGTGDPEGTIPERIGAVSELPALAASADMMIVTLPLTQDSRGVVSANVLHALKRGAIVINVGRGATVDEGALLAALDDGSIGGAYLDVFSEEPLPAGHAFWSHPRATVTPHVSGGSWDLLFELFTQNLIRYANEVPLLNLVSPERGY